MGSGGSTGKGSKAKDAQPSASAPPPEDAQSSASAPPPQEAQSSASAPPPAVDEAAFKSYDPIAEAKRKNDEYLKKDTKQQLVSREEEQSQLGKIEAAFRTIDKDRSGYLDEKEIEEGLRSAGIEPPTDMATFMKEADCNSDGKVDLKEFIRIAGKLLDPSMGGALNSQADYRKWMEMIHKSTGLPLLSKVAGTVAADAAPPTEADSQNVCTLMNERQWGALFDLFHPNVQAVFPKQDMINTMEYFMASGAVASVAGATSTAGAGKHIHYNITRKTLWDTSVTKLTWILANGQIYGLDPSGGTTKKPAEEPTKMKVGLYFDTNAIANGHCKWHAEIGEGDEYLAGWTRCNAPHQTHELFEFYLMQDGKRVELEQVELEDETGCTPAAHNKVLVTRAKGPGTIILEQKWVHLHRKIELYNEGNAGKYHVEKDLEPLTEKQKPELLDGLSDPSWKSFVSKGDMTWKKDEENIIMFCKRVWAHINANFRYDCSPECCARLTYGSIVDSGFAHCIQRSRMMAAILQENGIDARYNLTNAHTFVTVLVPGVGWVPMEPTSEHIDPSSCDTPEALVAIGTPAQVSLDTLGVWQMLVDEAKEKLIRVFDHKDPLEGEISDFLLPYWPGSFESFKSFGPITFKREGVFKDRWICVLGSFANLGGREFTFQLLLGGGQITGLQCGGPEVFDQKKEEFEGAGAKPMLNFGDMNPVILCLKKGKNDTKPAKFYYENVLKAPGKIVLSPIEDWSNQFGFDMK